MGLYEDLRRIDILGPVEGMIAEGTLPVTRRMDFEHKGVAKIRTPFIHTNTAWDRLCNFWQGICWQIYGFVPRGCQNCWKIVAKPRTLRELMDIFKLQRKIGLPSKCGMERRHFTCGIYSAFWYSPLAEGLNGARKLWREIRDKVHEEVGDLEVILKRA